MAISRKKTNDIGNFILETPCMTYTHPTLLLYTT